jgi:GT2 family glycosyltransferase
LRYILKDLSIIIVNSGSLDTLSHCLASLSSIPETFFSFEVIIIDNVSSNGKLGEFRKNYPHFSFIPNRGHWGFSDGNNLGASYADGKYLLFFNPSTIVSEKSLLKMLDLAKVSKSDSIISCRQIKGNDNENKPNEIFSARVALGGWRGVLAGLLNFSMPQKKRIAFTDWVSWSMILIRKASFTASILTQIGVNSLHDDYTSLQKSGFKEAYGGYFWF